MNSIKFILQTTKWLRILSWIVISFASGLVLLYTAVNWYGAKRWREAQAMIARESETLDFRKTLREPVPESQNFCAIPVLKDLALVIDNDPNKGEPATKRKQLENAALPDKNEKLSQPKLNLGATFGKPTDMNAWTAWLNHDSSVVSSADSPKKVLAALSKHDDLFRELSAGLSRPEAQWTPEWKTRDLPEMIFAVPLPYYVGAQKIARTLSLRATAAAQAGDVAKAHESALITSRICEASLNDTLLIGQLVAAAQAALLCGSVWEICNAQSGNATDFQRLEETLSRLNFQQACLQAFRSELAGISSSLKWLMEKRDARMFDVITENGRIANRSGGILMELTPRGMFDMNTATVVELEFASLIRPLRDEGLTAALRAGASLDVELRRRKASFQPDSLVACIAVPAVAQITHRIAYTQCLVNQAVAACALERWRIEHGSYPDSLAEVKLANGKPLPNDVISEKPMGYRKTPDGKYALWCVGFDGKDDGGKRTLDKNKPEGTRFHDANYIGDWVWSYSAE